MNGRKVCVISAHLGLNYDVIVDNTNDLINAVSNEEYFILCLDANVDHTDSSAALYTESIKRFIDLGYNMANGGDHGLFKTYASSNIAIDNVVTSANINIKAVVMDKQKEGLADGTDHYPLIAYVEVF
jgi:endonuclease/exonuclease/phosphatase family metal-dependent hydrolase